MEQISASLENHEKRYKIKSTFAWTSLCTFSKNPVPMSFSDYLELNVQNVTLASATATDFATCVM